MHTLLSKFSNVSFLKLKILFFPPLISLLPQILVFNFSVSKRSRINRNFSLGPIDQWKSNPLDEEATNFPEELAAGVNNGFRVMPVIKFFSAIISYLERRDTKILFFFDIKPIFKRGARNRRSSFCFYVRKIMCNNHDNR